MSFNLYLEKLEIDYELRQMILERSNELTEKQKQHALSYIDNKIIEDKRAYRKSLKMRHDIYYQPYNPEPVGVIVASHGDMDGGWMKVFVDGEHWTEEEKQSFIDSNWIHYRPSPYDCTGQRFTEGIDVFNVPRGVVIYIREGVDV